MKFSIAAKTDVGLVKNVNQDGLYVANISSKKENIVFAILCDGMGGHSKGEVASTTVIKAFKKWSKEQLPQLLEKEEIEDSDIRSQWENLIVSLNDKIMTYGKSQGITLGTTAVIMLLTQKRYYIMNVGDSRAYEICDESVVLTKDQTFVAREIEQGRMTPEEAMNDPRKNVLLQSVGASQCIYPDMFFGETKCNAVYMMCSDGFRHVITNDEIFENFNPNILKNEIDMENNAGYLIELNKQRSERDNISVVLIKTE